MAINTVMVIGAGQMGGGIAQVFASIGKKTYLNDIKQEFIDGGIAKITKNLDRSVSKGKITEEQKNETLKNIIPALDIDQVAGECDVIVEAAIENMEIKAKLFEKLDQLCKPECILATNTSSLPITEIAAHTKRADKVIGMHFMNPVPVMKLVELIRGLATSDETFKTIKALGEEMGKTPVEVRDVPGFVSNRVLQMMINEAIYCVYEGVATPQDIDTVMKLGMNHPMGPIELADFIGLDTVLAIMNVLYEGYADSKYRPCPLLRQYVKAGWVGRQCGRGFYTYDK